MLLLVLEVVPRFGFRVRIGVTCERGSRRDRLEDAYLSAPELGVFAIADGMGGHAFGEVASEEALAEIRRAVDSTTTQKIAKRYFERPDLDARRRVLDRMRRVVERAHVRLRRIAADRPEPVELGTTLDLIWLLRDEAFIAHVGDSRAYIVRSNAVLQITEDHATPVANQFANEEPHTFRRGVTSLTRAIGLGDSIAVDTLRIDLRRGDRLLLATDGVWAAFHEESEIGHAARQGDAQAASAELASLAMQRSFDDRTALIVEIAERFVRHQSQDSDAISRDVAPVVESALFTGMSWPRILGALAIAVHVEFDAGQAIPHRSTGDRVAYVVLDGLVRLADGRRLGSGATLFAECLVGCDPTAESPICEERVRAIRIRRDDFQELCTADPSLSADLYRRLAEHLGRRLGR